MGYECVPSINSQVCLSETVERTNKSRIVPDCCQCYAIKVLNEQNVLVFLVTENITYQFAKYEHKHGQSFREYCIPYI